MALLEGLSPQALLMRTLGGQNPWIIGSSGDQHLERLSVYAGYMPMILVISGLISANMYLMMPKDPKDEDSILQVWLQARLQNPRTLAIILMLATQGSAMIRPIARGQFHPLSAQVCRLIGSPVASHRTCVRRTPALCAAPGPHFPAKFIEHQGLPETRILPMHRIQMSSGLSRRSLRGRRRTCRCGWRSAAAASAWRAPRS